MKELPNEVVHRNDILIIGKCPFIISPTNDCFCVFKNSGSIEKTLYYCGGHFKECEIYKMMMKRSFKPAILER